MHDYTVYSPNTIGFHDHRRVGEKQEHITLAAQRQKSSMHFIVVIFTITSFFLFRLAFKLKSVFR